MTTIADTLAVLLPHLGRELLSDRARARLLAAGDALPAALSRCIYIECRPETTELADLIVDVDVHGGEMLAGTGPAIGLSPAQRLEPAWTPVIAFARAWTDRGGTLCHDVSGAWLEFDLAAGASPPAPSLFVDFSERAARAGPERGLGALTAVLTAVGRPLTTDSRRRLSSLLAALPASAAVLYAGVMLARDTSATRLCIMGLMRTQLLDYLRAVHWAGNMDQLDALMASLADASGGGQEQPAIVHLDAGASLGGSVGLEYPLARQPQLAGEIAESALLDNFATRGLLTPAHRRALREWVGWEQRTMAHELWPSVIVRRVNHVKLVLSANGALGVKLYLCAESVARADLRPARARGG